MKIKEFIAEQLHERYKHFVIYGPPLQGKTKLAKHIADIFDGIYIDILKEFQEDVGKKSGIDIFGPTKLITFLKQYNHDDKKLLVIDQMDFLINTWDEDQFRELMAFIDLNQSEVSCMFIMHNYRILERDNPIKENDKGHSRLINIYTIQQGGILNG